MTCEWLSLVILYYSVLSAFHWAYRSTCTWWFNVFRGALVGGDFRSKKQRLEHFLHTREGKILQFQIINSLLYEDLTYRITLSEYWRSKSGARCLIVYLWHITHIRPKQFLHPTKILLITPNVPFSFAKNSILILSQSAFSMPISKGVRLAPWLVLNRVFPFLISKGEVWYHKFGFYASLHSTGKSLEFTLAKSEDSSNNLFLESTFHFYFKIY